MKAQQNHSLLKFLNIFLLYNIKQIKNNIIYLKLEISFGFESLILI